MPLNKLENFIKNAEGRILYVNPNDLDSTDGIENQGNSLTKPFKTIQRALIESARFSYLRGDDNDLTEKTTILVFPGEHLIDNRPGFRIRDNGSGNALAEAPGGATSSAQDELTLTLNSNFDLTQEDNILYKFNSINGGIIIPRGTSIVGLDLRKTKVRPKYVPNPTDPNVPSSAIFRITGACYFWQFTFFDGDDSGVVYTDPTDFSTTNRSKPTFSHHKLTCFEYADGVNKFGTTGLTDLDMYYSKISNAFNRASGREIDQKYPATPEGFAKQRPEWEIVGAFATDPTVISSIKSGDGATPNTIITVETQTNHNLNSGTPIKIRGVSEADYNISTKVLQVINDTTFTYALPSVRANLPAGVAAGLQFGNATVTIETDTVSGASPYIFNVSLRSVYGMQGMHADGSKADGFRSMVVAQFTAVSLQKDDRAFTKYFTADRIYDQGKVTLTKGEELSQKSNSPNVEKIYHLDSDAVYREGWQSSHIKMSNDAVIQVVSVFAIGFHKHFECNSGGDASITNSNSNFGQFSLASDGFKKTAFTKDDKGFITSIIPPKSIVGSDINVDVEYVQIDLSKTKHILGRTGSNAPSAQNRIYLLGYDKLDVPPPIISQGYRIGAKVDEEFFLSSGGSNYSAKILMADDEFDSSTNTISGTVSSAKVYKDVFINTALTQNGATTVFNTTAAHKLKNGESIRIFSEIGDLPDGLERGKVYYAITKEKNSGRSDGITLGNTQLQLASSKTNAEAQTPIYITCYPNTKVTSRPLQLRIESRVSDKKAGELGHPIQFDTKLHGGYTRADGDTVSSAVGGWFILTTDGSDLLSRVNTLASSSDSSDITFIRRRPDDRSLDEKLYRIRYVIPKEADNTRDPVSGFVLQDSATVNVRETADHVKTSITREDHDFDRNTRFISTCRYESGSLSAIGGPGFDIRSDKPHNLQKGDIVIITDVKDSTNPTGIENTGFNGEFEVGFVENDKEFQVSNRDVFGSIHAPGTTSTNDVSTRNTTLPKFTRNNNQKNLYVYRVETITNYIKDIQDGVFYLYVLNANNSIESEFTVDKFSQNVTDLYPQEDRDNFDDNPPAANSYAKRTPIGEVVTDDLKRSITRETVDIFYDSFGLGHKITSASVSNTSATLTFSNAHQLGAVRTVTGLDGGSGHTPGTYYNVKLLNNATTVWDGATAKVVVNSSGTVTSVDIIEGGSGYASGEELDIDWRTAEGGIGGAANAHVDTQASGISTATADYVQITGISTVTDAYYRITTVTKTNEVGIARTSGDPGIFANHYAVVVGRVGVVNGTPTASNNVLTVTTTEGHGLVAGNQIRFTDTSNNNKGDFLVSDVPSPTSFTVATELASTLASSVKYVMKHGMSANNASADALGENIGTRSLPDYDHEVLFLDEDITTEEQFEVSLPSGSSDIISRFPLGSYIQVGNEIMRVKSTTLGGSSSNELQVIRGAMGTIIEAHKDGALIKKIKLQPIELRRPSILRASGHTFEYLGYGPGNYSTGLPQVQVKTLTEDEEFLSQSQETSCGTVLYTGMDSDGDFYIGNTKYSAQSGEQKTFDVPTPTVTGEDPNRLSVVFDEVIVKERILVEGGKSKQILSQFDGPVTYNGAVRMNDRLVLNDKLKIGDTTDATKCDDSNAALRVLGGAAIGKRLFVCGDIDTDGGLDVAGNTILGDANSDTLTVNATSTFGSKMNVNADIDMGDNNKLLLGTGDDLQIYHDGNNSLIKDTGTGSLIINATTFNVKDASNSKTWIETNADNQGNAQGVKLRYNNLLKFETQANGAKVHDNLEVTERLNVGQDGTNICAKFGNGDEVQINVTNNGTIQTKNSEGHFRGIADKSDLVLIKASARGGGDEKPLLMVGTGSNAGDFPNSLGGGSADIGAYAQIRRDVHIRFSEDRNELVCSGDIVAFASDDRLKTNKVGISNALEKVNALSGFTFNWTEWACEQGGQFDPTKRFVGVSAQEVEKVLPEAVSPAPFNNDYLTVRYEKIVPLLIEAIKELSDKVSNLEERLNN